MELTLNYTTLALSILALAGTVLGWFARQLWSAVQGLAGEVNDLRVLIGTEYIRYDRLQDALKPILESLGEIKHTLISKADK
jgi:hypothetical protein